MYLLEESNIIHIVVYCLCSGSYRCVVGTECTYNTLTVHVLQKQSKLL